MTGTAWWERYLHTMQHWPLPVRWALTLVAFAALVGLTVLLDLTRHPFTLLYPFLVVVAYYAPRRASYALTLLTLLAAMTLLTVPRLLVPWSDIVYEESLIGLTAVALITVLAQKQEVAGMVKATEHQARVLRALGTYALTRLPREEMMQAVTAYITTALDVDGAVLLLVEDDGLHLSGVADMGNGVGSVDVRRPVDGTVTGDIYRTARPHIIHDIRTEPRFMPVLGAALRSCVGVPLLLRDWPIGVLYVGKDRPGYFGQEDVSRVEVLAEAVAVAVQINRPSAHIIDRDVVLDQHDTD